MKPSWGKISILFLFIVALIGTLLRSTLLFKVDFVYSHLLHAHSHTAFQGWIYTIMFLLASTYFFSEEQRLRYKLSLQFKFTIVVVTCILIAFTLQGYALYSILFSTLFQILNYWLIFSFFKATRKETTSGIRYPLLFARTGMVLGGISTLAPFGVGILSANGLSGTELYDSFIYFFLHFQYNGWFFFVLLGIVLKDFENQNIAVESKRLRTIYLLFTLAVVPLFALSLTGMEFGATIRPIAFVGSFLSFLALLFLITTFRKKQKLWLKETSAVSKWFLYLAFFSLAAKTILQLASLLPVLEPLVFHNRYLIMVYMHLSLIGFMSFAFLGIILKLCWINVTALTRVGSILLIFGFISNEMALSLSALTSFHGSILIFITSGMMAVGILFILLSYHFSKS
jgi:hypothetical protein